MLLESPMLLESHPVDQHVLHLPSSRPPATPSSEAAEATVESREAVPRQNPCGSMVEKTESFNPSSM